MTRYAVYKVMPDMTTMIAIPQANPACKYKKNKLQTLVQHVNIKKNKKVLLRECKRHTARRVASARGGGGCTYLGRGEVPTLGYPPLHPDLAGGGVHSLDRGVPPPPFWPGRWGNYLRQGVPTLAGVPPPPGCGQTPVKTVPSRRTTYAGGNKLQTLVQHLLPRNILQ